MKGLHYVSLLDLYHELYYRDDKRNFARATFIPQIMDLCLEEEDAIRPIRLYDCVGVERGVPPEIYEALLINLVDHQGSKCVPGNDIYQVVRYAIYDGYSNLIKILMTSPGYDPDEFRIYEGTTEFLCACKFWYGMESKIIRNQCKVSMVMMKFTVVTNEERMTALMRICSGYPVLRLHEIEMLIDAILDNISRCNPEYTNYDGETVLIVACKEGCKYLAKELIVRDLCDLTAISKDGLSALDWCEEDGMEEIRDLLLKKIEKSSPC